MGKLRHPSTRYGSKNPIDVRALCTINCADPVAAARHALRVALGEQMLALHQRRAAARTPHEQGVIAAQIAATDRQIDRLVYELYGLSEEVRIVEGGSAIQKQAE